MFIDWIIPAFGWTQLVGGCLFGIIAAISFRAPHTEPDPLRRAMLPIQNWISVGLACFMIGVGAVALLRPTLNTILALKPFIGVGLGIANVALASATPHYIRRLWLLVPRDALHRWRRWMLIALGMMGEGASLMGIGGGALLIVPMPYGPELRAMTTVVFGLGMLMALVGGIVAFLAATYRFSEQYMV